MPRRRAPPRFSPASASTRRRRTGRCSRILRRLAHARRARRRAVLRAGSPASRRADQLSRPRGALWLERLSAGLPAHDDDHQPRPRPSRRCRRPHPASRQRKADALQRRLYRASSASGASARCCRPSAAKKQEAQRTHLQAFVDRFRAKASKARQAQSRLKMLARMEPIAALVDESVAAVQIPADRQKLRRRRSSRIEDVTVGYEPGKPVLRASTCASIPTTASRCSAPTATANRPSPSCIAGRLAPMGGKMRPRRKLRGRLFRPAPDRRARRPTARPTTMCAS